MSSATSVVGNVLSYMTKSTAATNVSFTAGAKSEVVAGSVSFDTFFANAGNKVSTNTNANTNNVNTNANQKAATKSEIVSSKEVKNESPDTQKTEKAEPNKDNKPLDETATADENTKAVNTNETDGKEADSKLQEAISEDGKKLIEEIASALDVSEDEILAVMQMIGILPQDLLNPENILQVVNAVSGTEDGLNILVDSELYTDIKDILTEVQDMRDEITEEFNVTPEEINQTISKPKEEASYVAEEKEPEDEVETTENVQKANVKEIVKTVEKNEEQVFETEEPVIEKKVVETTGQRKQESGSFNHSEQHTSPFNQIVNNIVDAAVSTESTQTISYTDRAQMEQIVRQITDKITVSMGPEETSMELQLHPASLGNVNVLLQSSKDGGIIAKFTAQNEIVKEAVESQMMVLQQKFDEQGIKVTSIEVTIASHAFEQNLQQDDNGESARDQMEKNKKTLRRINLNEIDEELEEEMTQAEMIAAQMMAYNGNQIDFSA